MSLIPEISPDSWPCSSSQGELVPSCGHLSCCLRSRLNQTKFPETVNPVVCVCTEDVDVIHTFLKKKKRSCSSTQFYILFVYEIKEVQTIIFRISIEM